MGRWLLGALCALFAIPATASADGRPLATLDAVHEACAEAREAVHPELYVLELDAGWRFAPHRPRADELPVDTRRNLRALDGRVSVLLTGFEPVGFDADEAQARALREAARAGTTLRIGFFLGFDEPRRAPCVVRNRHAVTIVRADLAFAELVSSAGERVARTETDRLRAWTDDREALAIPGEGPRGAVGEARFSNGTAAPASWQQALANPELRGAVAQCHAAGVQRGAAGDGQVVVRLNVETRTGRVRRADVALSSLGDDEEAECLARAVGRHAGLGPGPSSWQAEFVDLTVPLRLAAD
jgi:hypothetical protein